MGEKCGAEVTDDVDEYDRDNRIETYYQGWGAREMAERIVELEDELGADVDGICTGMHADVAEARAEIDRLTSLVGYWEHRAEESCRAVETLEGVADSAIRERDVNCEVGRQWAGLAERYRLAWLSARRRAADEANYGLEALELKRQEISRLEAALDEVRKTTHGPRLECVGPDGEGGEVWRVVDDSKKP